jgi:hypothetical protein
MPQLIRVATLLEGGALPPWARYSSALAALLNEAQNSGLVLDFTQDIAFRTGTQSTIAGVSGWTYTRSGSAYDLAGTTLFGANTPRRTSAGLLVEAGATNLQTRSSEFTDADWNAAANSTKTTGQAGPDGSTAAAGFSVTSVGSISYFQAPIVSLNFSTTYAWSVYARAIVGDTLHLVAQRGFGEVAVSFNLVNGTASGTGASIQNVGGGWYRCVYTFTTAASGTTPAAATYFLDAYGVAGKATTIHVFGAQVETGSTATSYIPTTSSSAARGADAASMTFTVARPYSVIAEYFLAQTPGTTTRIVDFGISSIPLYTPNIFNVVTFDGSGAVAANYSGTPVNRVARAASAHATGDVAIAVDGSAASTGTTPAAGTSTVWLGSSAGAAQFLNGNLRLLAILPRRITNAELQAATA